MSDESDRGDNPGAPSAPPPPEGERPSARRPDAGTETESRASPAEDQVFLDADLARMLGELGIEVETPPSSTVVPPPQPPTRDGTRARIETAPAVPGASATPPPAPASPLVPSKPGPSDVPQPQKESPLQPAAPEILGIPDTPMRPPEPPGTVASVADPMEEDDDSDPGVDRAMVMDSLAEFIDGPADPVPREAPGPEHRTPAPAPRAVPERDPGPARDSGSVPGGPRAAPEPAREPIPSHPSTAPATPPSPASPPPPLVPAHNPLAQLFDDTADLFEMPGTAPTEAAAPAARVDPPTRPAPPAQGLRKAPETPPAPPRPAPVPAPAASRQAPATPTPSAAAPPPRTTPTPETPAPAAPGARATAAPLLERVRRARFAWRFVLLSGYSGAETERALRDLFLLLTLMLGLVWCVLAWFTRHQVPTIFAVLFLSTPLLVVMTRKRP